MKRAILLVLGVCFVSTAVVAARQAAPLKAAAAIELKDAAGDMGPIGTTAGDQPPLDVVLLAIKSDGTHISMAATLKGPLSPWATSPITLYIDSDNNPATGMKGFGSKPGGFEYKAELALCIKYSDKSEACHGGASGGKPTERYAAINLQRFKGDSEYGGDTVVDSMGFPGSKASAKTPVPALLVEASFDYADIKAKSGQVLRLMAKETGGSPTDGDGAFPIVIFTLK